MQVSAITMSDSKNGESITPFDYQPLVRVVYGPGTITRLGELTRSLGTTRALLVTDPGLEHAGHPQPAEKSLREAGVAVFTFHDVKENPTEREVDAGVDFAKRHGVDVIVAVGGGSSMDCAKGINFLLTNGGRMEDYKGLNRAKKPMLP